MRVLRVEGLRAERDVSGVAPGLFVVLGLALLARLVLAPLSGYFDDAQLYVNWGVLLNHHFFDFYSAGAQLSPQPNYPPLTIYIYGLLVLIYTTFCNLTGARPVYDLSQTGGLNLFMKLPTIIAELALAAVIYSLALRTLPRRRDASLAAAAAAFSPVVLLDGPLWGQLDAVSTLGLVLALVAAVRGRGTAAGVWFGLALMVKPQPLVFAPLLLAYLWRRAGRGAALRAAGGAAVAVVLICLPYLLPPRFEVTYLWQDTNDIVRALPNATLSAFNLWWLAGAQQAPYSDPYIGPFSPEILGYAIFAVVLALVLVGICRARAPGLLWTGVGVVATAFFVSTPLQHERYLYPAVVFYLIAALYDQRMWFFYWLSSALTFANMLIILVHPVVSSSGLVLPDLSRFIDQHAELATAIAALNLLTLLLAIVVFFDQVSFAVATGPERKDSMAAMMAQRLAGLRDVYLDPRRLALVGPAVAHGARDGMEALRRWMRALRLWAPSREGRAFFALFAVALIVRLPMLPFRGFFDDIQALVTWGHFLDRHALQFYSQGSSLNPPPDYPPLAMYLFGFLAGVYSLGSHLLGRTPTYQVDYSHALPAIFKMPIVVADLALFAVIYALARKLVPARWALIAAAAYALSPAILFGGVLWGQIDVLFVLGLVLALVAAVRGRGTAAGVWFGLALMVKPQPLVFAPLLLAYLWRRAGRGAALRAAGGAAVAVVLICLPYLLPPRFEVFAYQQDVDKWVHIVPYTSVSAFNFWWLLGVAKWTSSVALLGPFSPDVLGWAMFAVVLAVVTFGSWLDPAPARLFEGAGLLTVAFFILGTLQHERYLLPAVVFYLIAALYARRHAVSYVAVSIAAMLNMVLVVIAPPFSNSKIPYNLAIGRHYLTYHPRVFATLAALNVLLFLVLFAAYGVAAFGRAAAGNVRPAGRRWRRFIPGSGDPPETSSGGVDVRIGSGASPDALT